MSCVVTSGLADSAEATWWKRSLLSALRENLELNFPCRVNGWTSNTRFLLIFFFFLTVFIPIWWLRSPWNRQIFVYRWKIDIRLVSSRQFPRHPPPSDIFHFNDFPLKQISSVIYSPPFSLYSTAHTTHSHSSFLMAQLWNIERECDLSLSSPVNSLPPSLHLNLFAQPPLGGFLRFNALRHTCPATYSILLFSSWPRELFRISCNF